MVSGGPGRNDDAWVIRHLLNSVEECFLRFEQGRIDSIDRHFDRKPRVSCHKTGVGYGIICPTSLFVLLID